MSRRGEPQMELCPKSSGAPGAPPSSSERYIRHRVAAEVQRHLGRLTAASSSDAALSHRAVTDRDRAGDQDLQHGRRDAQMAIAPPPIPPTLITLRSVGGSVAVHDQGLAMSIVQQRLSSISGRNCNSRSSSLKHTHGRWTPRWQ